MKRTIKHTLILGGLLVGPLFYSAAQAQQPTSDTVKITAKTATGQWGDKQGLQLDGTTAEPAHVSHPQLDVKAPHIDVAFDDNRQLKNVNATGGVQFKISLTQAGNVPVRIEAKCDKAVLERTAKERVLTLTGNVDGWYQSGVGARNTLRGQSVKITSRPDAAESLVADIKGDANGIRLDVPPLDANAKGGTVVITAQDARLTQIKGVLNADVDGGTRGVRLEMPAQATGAAANGLQLGTVIVTSQRASVRQAEGTARFSGNAHASSVDGEAKFDVTAEELILTRNNAGALDNLQSSGRTKVKLDLPQDKPQTPAADNVGDNKTKPMPKPNYVEIEANKMTAQPSTGKLMFDGLVKGLYRLPPSKPGDAATDYPFSCEHADISYNAKAPGGPARGLNLNLSGGVEINAPLLLGDF